MTSGSPALISSRITSATLSSRCFGDHATDAFGGRDGVERADNVLHVLRDVLVDVALETRLRPAAALRAPRLFAFDLAHGFDPADSEHEDPGRVAVDDDGGVPAVTVGEANER